MTHEDNDRRAEPGLENTNSQPPLHTLSPEEYRQALRKIHGALAIGNPALWLIEVPRLPRLSEPALPLPPSSSTGQAQHRPRALTPAQLVQRKHASSGLQPQIPAPRLPVRPFLGALLLFGVMLVALMLVAGR